MLVSVFNLVNLLPFPGSICKTLFATCIVKCLTAQIDAGVMNADPQSIQLLTRTPFVVIETWFFKSRKIIRIMSDSATLIRKLFASDTRQRLAVSQIPLPHKRPPSEVSIITSHEALVSVAPRERERERESEKQGLNEKKRLMCNSQSFHCN